MLRRINKAGTGRFKFTKAIQGRLCSEGVFEQRLEGREGAGHEALRGAGSAGGGTNTGARSPVPEVEVGRAPSGKEASVPGTEGARQRVLGEQIRDKVEEAGVQDLGGHRRTWMFTLKEMSSRGVT